MRCLTFSRRCHPRWMRRANSGVMMGWPRNLQEVLAVGLFVALAAAPRIRGQAAASGDPEAARLITSDIQNFWRVLDGATPATAADLFQRDYLDIGSAGLRDFARLRVLSGAALAQAVSARSRYYAAIRANTLAIETTPSVKESIRAAFRRLKTSYPEAVFPDVYFVIGRLGSGGTTSPIGLLIGVEMNARGSDTPVDELTAWQRAVTGRIDGLSHIVAHELVHFQQRLAGDSSQTLLTRAIREGAADFVGQLISGGHINGVAHVYGEAHERALWDEFEQEMRGTDTSNWLAQADRSGDRPADLGYYIGYKICETFYERQTDKIAALRMILQASDAEEFLRLSAYSGGAK